MPDGTLGGRMSRNNKKIDNLEKYLLDSNFRDTYTHN
jgi:hypothetical protein